MVSFSVGERGDNLSVYNAFIYEPLPPKPALPPTLTKPYVVHGFYFILNFLSFKFRIFNSKLKSIFVQKVSFVGLASLEPSEAGAISLHSNLLL
jgi:hypothetical protein